LGVNIVEQVVLSQWQSHWQAIDGFNDDGADGLILSCSSSNARSEDYGFDGRVKQTIRRQGKALRPACRNGDR
jgi:hypothetical protein